MIKATATTPDGRTLLIVGLSFGNLDKFRAEPGDTFIRIDGATTGGIPIDVVIFSGETEAHLAKLIEPAIGAATKVHVSDKLNN
jgi:predicted alpha/beta-fold hydrolase